MDILNVIKSKGYSLKDVAVALGKNYNGLSMTINNNPTISTLRQIADVIGADVADFFADEKKPSSAGGVETVATLICPHCQKPIDLTAS